VRENRGVIASGWDDARSTAASTGTGEAIRGTDALGQFGFVGDQDGEPVLDREADVATGTDQRLLVAGESGLSAGVDRAAEESEYGVVHTVRI
jgi:hypothetical protein